MIKDNTETITLKEGYDAMYLFLHNYWELTDSIDLTDILSGGQYVNKEQIADSAFWDYWLDAINSIKNGIAPQIKTLSK